jgi:hypothetical protein
MTTLFDTVLLKGIRAGQVPARTERAREWYRDTAKSYRTVNERALLKSGEKDRFTNTPMVGSMYMYYYDPKHKSTLPYYDRFPLVFPFKKMKGGFLGINMHYLPLPYRAKLMDALYDISNNHTYDDSTRLKLNYKVLNSASRFKYFKPCIKHYLTDHLDSRMLLVHPTEWDIALFLPTQRFVGATKAQVWKESMSSINNTKAKP